MKKHIYIKEERLMAEDRMLLCLVRQGICSEETRGDIDRGKTGKQMLSSLKTGKARDGVNWNLVVEKAKKHSVLSLLYDPLCEDAAIPEHIKRAVTDASRMIVRQSYRLLFLTRYVVELLEKEQISVLVLKGAAAALLYPVPELRKSGDVDILVADDQEFARACILLGENGFFQKAEQKTNHHISFSWKGGIEVELHHQLAEPFDSDKTNRYLEKLKEEYTKGIRRDCLAGICLPMPGDGHHGFYLLLHMLQHYLRAGFGLKLLADWVVYWNRGVAEHDRKIMIRLLWGSGLHGFASMVTEACVRYLGLCEENVKDMGFEKMPREAVEEFMREVLEAEEFGKSQKNRMVAMRGTRLRDYLREFHHQMRLNYPRAGRYVILWPFLWCSALAVFLYNNRKVRGISSIDILKTAKKRSKLIEEMKLFARNDRII